MTRAKNDTYSLNLKNIGSLIKSKRKEKGFTQVTLAEKIGISALHCSRIERGECIPSLQTFLMIVEVLDLDISKLKLNTNDNVSSTMYEILRLLEKFNNTQQQAVLSFLKTMNPVNA